MSVTIRDSIMAVIQLNPRTPGQRFMQMADFSVLTKKAPEKRLLAPVKKSGGRNNRGRMTIRHRGGGHKRRLRMIDFKRTRDGIPAVVAALEYDPNRSANIALLHYADGDKRYILAPEGLKVGDKVECGAGGGYQARQCSAAEEYSGRHGRSCDRAKARSGCATRARRRYAGAADGQRGQVRSAQVALRRAAHGSGGMPRDDRSGRQSRSREYLDRQGGALRDGWVSARMCAVSR